MKQGAEVEKQTLEKFRKLRELFFLPAVPYLFSIWFGKLTRFSFGDISTGQVPNSTSSVGHKLFFLKFPAQIKSIVFVLNYWLEKMVFGNLVQKAISKLGANLQAYLQFKLKDSRYQRIQIGCLSPFCT